MRNASAADAAADRLRNERRDANGRLRSLLLAIIHLVAAILPQNRQGFLRGTSCPWWLRFRKLRHYQGEPRRNSCVSVLTFLPSTDRQETDRQKHDRREKLPTGKAAPAFPRRPFVKRPLVALMMMICIALAIAVFLPATSAAQVGSAKNAT